MISGKRCPVLAVCILWVQFLFICSALGGNEKYIDPTIGNVSRFLVPTYPTMHLPNQMMRMHPVKRDYISDQIDVFPFFLFAHRHVESPGIKIVPGDVEEKDWEQMMNIDHDLEVVHPWFYSTRLIDQDTTVQFVPARKSAVYKFEFPVGIKQNLLVRGSENVKFSCSGSSFSVEEKIEQAQRGPDVISRAVPLFIYAVLEDAHGAGLDGVEFGMDEDKCQISFPPDGPSVVFLKYAVSYVSAEQAEINFNEDLKGQTFDALALAGKADWARVCDQFEIEGGTESQKRTFFTALYRTYERMVDINEHGKYFSGYDGKVHESDRPFYVDDWVWDTYLAAHPLRTILNPELQNDMINSYVQMYEQSGWMPTFPQVYGNLRCMNCYHSASVVLDGYRKGLRNYDVEKAYEGIKKNLTEATMIPWRQGVARTELDDFYSENGYFPALHPGQEEKEKVVDGFERRQAVPVTLGISYDYWALAQLAGDLGKKDDFAEFSPKGKNYKNLWNPEVELFMPKDKKGRWVYIDPKSGGGYGYRDYFDENNGWTYAWDVKHDVFGLIDLLGGKKAAEERLDQLFREPLGMRRKDFFVDGVNSTGMVGQFSMGNEPSFHIPYLYNYFGAPWKTQKRTRFLLDVFFKDNIFGIPGDEDGGGMSAFVVFSSMGLYPVTPGLPYYNITSPVFEKTTIRLMNGKKFTILAKGASRRSKYIQKAFINGVEIDGPFITHDQIMSGGTLELELAELPNKEWGKNTKPPMM